MYPNKKSNKNLSTTREFLNEVYSALQYEEGALFDATDLPNEKVKNEWIDKGDWLSLAAEIGAEKVFFVNNDPVIVFCSQESFEDQDLLKLFRRYWCMARPQCLFLALPGELRVYSLNQDPIRDETEWRNLKPLDVVNKVADVAEKLQAYRREYVETGQLFKEKSFGALDQRADKRLIQDLKQVRKALLEAGLDARHAHALIGRSIFIRYLEDREILTFDYFAGIAAQSSEWTQLLSTEHHQLIYTVSPHPRWYDRVLRNKSFTYALFDQLAEDFNGDMFPRDRAEENAVTQAQLDLLSKFLLGDADPNQPALFLWAYDFEIIPTDLISNIYEEFYHANNDDDKGTHYTPAVLVEYVLQEVLNETNLLRNPRILDPACGSGIFLVEAFRRIVRFQVQQLGRQLNSKELRNILKAQIAGIEINSEAVHVAAFSLYLALLHYQDPPDIRKNPRLPKLIFRYDESTQSDSFGILFNNNTFTLTPTERNLLTMKLEEKSRFKGRTKLENFLEVDGKLPLERHSFDIVVGNPPWGTTKGISQEIQKSWCNAFEWSVGYMEPSQAFIARVLNLLKPNGECGLLVSTGVFLKSQDNSERFRDRWLEETSLRKVVNFAHVRHVFFRGADSPFCFVQFMVNQPTPSHKFQYWSAKRTEVVDQLQVVTLNLNDMRLVGQGDIRENSYLWKTYWWGNHRDAALIKALMLETSLGKFISDRVGVTAHRGFKGASGGKEDKLSGWLSEFRQLPGNNFYRYGPILQEDLVDAPEMVIHQGSRELYEGWRILVKRTFGSQGEDNGIIVARLDNVPYCSNAVIGFSVDYNVDEWERKIIIGVLWSSLARYFLFLISRGWGVYHYEILQTELMSLPIRFPNDIESRNRIITTVDKLLSLAQKENDIALVFSQGSELSRLEDQLNDAVFDLYRLSSSERDLVEDMCTTGLQLLYRDTTRDALSRVPLKLSDSFGTISELSSELSYQVNINDYIHTFLQVWNRELEPDGGELSWNVVRADNVPMIAIVFTTQYKGKAMSVVDTHTTNWDEVLARCAAALRQPVSHRIYIDGMVRAVTDTEIYIIKRDETRLWTRSMAREDAEATLLQAMHLQARTTVQDS